MSESRNTKCSTCNAKIDLRVNSNTTCTGCDELFCDSRSHTCFEEHRRIKKCMAIGVTILCPDFEITLKESVT